jgi:hypothetical protein
MLNNRGVQTFLVKDHNLYCELVRGSHVQESQYVVYFNLNYCVIITVYIANLKMWQQAAGWTHLLDNIVMISFQKL